MSWNLEFSYNRPMFVVNHIHIHDAHTHTHTHTPILMLHTNTTIILLQTIIRRGCSSYAVSPNLTHTQKERVRLRWSKDPLQNLTLLQVYTYT